LALFLASTLQSFLGFGYGILAMTTMALALGVVTASGVVNITGMVQVAWVAWALRRNIRWSYMLRLLPGMSIGLAVGLFTLENADPTWLIRTLGATITAIAAWNLRPLHGHGRGSPFWDLVVGFSSGSIGGAFNTGGPPVIAYLYRRPDPPEVLKGTVQIYFLVFTIVRLSAASAVGLIDAHVVRIALTLVPLIVAGAATGLTLSRRVSPERFRTTSWLALGFMGIVLALRA